MATAPKRIALLGLAVGLVMALSANLTYAIPRGPVVVGLGVAAPIVLPLVLYIRSSFTVSGFWRTLCREAAMLAVAGPAVAISYVHTYSLVLDAEPHWPVLALIAPLSSDGVAGMSTMALHWTKQVVRKPATQSIGRKATPKPATAPTPTVAATPPSEIGERSQQRVAMVMWAQTQNELPPIKAIQNKFRVSQSTAKRVRADAREQVAS